MASVVGDIVRQPQRHQREGGREGETVEFTNRENAWYEYGCCGERDWLMENFEFWIRFNVLKKEKLKKEFLFSVSYYSDLKKFSMKYS